MKTKINTFERLREISKETSLKRKVMLRAWLLKKTCGVTKYIAYTDEFGEERMMMTRSLNFADCLREAWKIEKENMIARPTSAPIITTEGYNSFYRNTKYYGD